MNPNRRQGEVTQEKSLNAGAIALGREHAEKGMMRNRCPFANGTREADAWYAGWDAWEREELARRQAKEKESS